MLTAAKHQAEFLAIQQRLLVCTRTSLQRTQERYKRDLDQRGCGLLYWISTEDYVFIDVSNGFTKKLKLGNSVEGAYQMLGQNRSIMVFQRKTLVKSITVDSIALVSRPAGLTSIPLEVHSVWNIQIYRSRHHRG